MKDTRNLLPIGIAAIIALGITVAARWLMPGGGAASTNTSRRDANEIPMPDIPLMRKDEKKHEEVDVLVVAKNIKRGTKVIEDVLTWKKWPKSALQSIFIARDAKGNPLNNGGDYRLSLTMWTGSDLVEGEPLIISKLLNYDPIKKDREDAKRKAEDAKRKAEAAKKDREKKRTGAKIHEGMRAITFSIDQKSASSMTMLAPGDIVDVLISEQRDGKTRMHKYKAVKILAVDGATSREKSTNDGGSFNIGGSIANSLLTPKNVTLEIPENLVETMLKQVGNGGVILSLRNQDTAGTEEEGSTKIEIEDSEHRGDFVREFMMKSQMDTASSLRRAQDDKDRAKAAADIQTQMMNFAAGNKNSVVNFSKEYVKHLDVQNGAMEMYSGKVVKGEDLEKDFDEHQSGFGPSGKKKEATRSMVIYRGLKPSSVVVDEEGKVKSSSDSSGGLGM